MVCFLDFSCVLSRIIAFYFPVHQVFVYIGCFCVYVCVLCLRSGVVFVSPSIAVSAYNSVSVLSSSLGENKLSAAIKRCFVPRRCFLCPSMRLFCACFFFCACVCIRVYPCVVTCVPCFHLILPKKYFQVLFPVCCVDFCLFPEVSLVLLPDTSYLTCLLFAPAADNDMNHVPCPVHSTYLCTLYLACQACFSRLCNKPSRASRRSQFSARGGSFSRVHFSPILYSLDSRLCTHPFC